MSSQMFWLAPRVFPFEHFIATAGEESVQIHLEFEVDLSLDTEPLLSARISDGGRLDVLARNSYGDREGRVWSRLGGSTVREPLLPLLTALKEMADIGSFQALYLLLPLKEEDAHMGERAVYLPGST